MTDSEVAAGFRAPEPAELAELFPQYEIEYLVATGGMGAVYRAVQKSLDRVVAIKILPGEFAQDIDFCAAFEAEAKAMGRVNHPNLIGVFDFGEVGGMLYIVMEYVEGQSLHEYCEGQPIKSSEAVRLMVGICEGLAHAHEHGVLHRDIKPANILLDGHLQPKIGDFGLARPIDRKIEEGEMIFGTPGYTAPEVIEPPHDFDHHADIFSLGVLLHELLTGNLPTSDPRPASAQVRSHPRLDAVIRKATQPDPSLRYETAREMAEELSKIGSAGGRNTSALVVTGRHALPNSAGQAPAMAASQSGGALRARSAGLGGASIGRPAASPAAGALGGARPTMLASSTSSDNSPIIIVLVILALAGIAFLMLRGNSGGDDAENKPKGPALEDLINSQIGPDGLPQDKPPTAPVAQPPVPESPDSP